MIRKLVRLCEHDEFKPHPIEMSGFFKLGDCPGGEFLPEGALVIEKVDGEWPEGVMAAWFCRSNRALRERPGICLDRRSFHPQCCWVVIVEVGTERRPTGWNSNASALASQVGESE